MENMKELLDQTKKNLQKYSKDFPRQLGAFNNLMEAVEAPGALDKKHKELIAIGLSIATHCQWCIAWHVKGALDAGATADEILEAGWVAVLMGGGPSLMYFQLLEKALEDFKG